MPKFAKITVMFFLMLCLSLPALSADVRKKCSFDGKRTDAKGSIGEFTFVADYVVRDGPDSFTGTISFSSPSPNDPNQRKTAAAEGKVVKGEWTIHLTYNPDGSKETGKETSKETSKETWKGKGSLDKKTGRVTVKGTGTEDSGKGQQSVCTFEMSGDVR